MNYRRIIMLFVLAAALLEAGCNRNKPAGSIAGQPDGAALKQEVSPKYAAENSSAVESAIAISAKYAKLLEEVSVVKEKMQALEAENRHLKDELIPCKSQLAQAQKELNEANDLLIEMRVELNNWKSNILGFRSEMRQANTAQLEALFQILTILGAERDPNAAAAEGNQK